MHLGLPRREHKLLLRFTKSELCLDFIKAYWPLLAASRDKAIEIEI